MLGHGRFKFETPNVIDPGEESLSQPTRRPRIDEHEDGYVQTPPRSSSSSSPSSHSANNNLSRNSSFSSQGSDYVYKKPLGASKTIQLNYRDEDPGDEPGESNQLEEDDVDMEYGKIESNPSMHSINSNGSSHSSLAEEETPTPDKDTERARLYGATLLTELERRESRRESFLGKLTSPSRNIWNGKKFTTSHDQDLLELERDGLMKFHNYGPSSSKQKQYPSIPQLQRVKWCGITLIVIALCFGFGITAYSNVSTKHLSQRMQHTVNMLSDNGISTRKSLLKSATAQYQAAVWVADHDKEQLPIPTSLDESGASHDSDRFIQRYVLALMYYSWDGNNWNDQLKFVTENHECSWDNPILETGNEANKNTERSSFALGVSCDDNLIVQSLSMPSNNLKGIIPDEIQYLKGLELLGLSKNSLEGTIPSTLSTLPLLKELALDDNMLTGNLFDTISSDMTNLQYLYVEDNEFTGNLDNGDTVVELTSLVEADLSGNSFQVKKQLPPEIFALPNLKVLDLAANNIRAGLPDNIPTNGVLEYLNLRLNSISSTLPTSISNLVALTHLDLESNGLDGELPGEALATLANNLTYLFLGKNPKLEKGEIPNEFQSLTKLRELSLDDINLTGTIPNWLEQLTDLKLLDLRYNDLTGTIDEIDFSRLSGLSYLLLSDNKFTGPIPAGRLSGLDELAVLAVHHNGFIGDASDLCAPPSTGNDPAGDVQLVTTDCGEVKCTCCDDCCDSDNCYEGLVWDSLESSQGSWEEHFQRADYSFNPHIMFGP